ncbi:MAG: DUF4962 domain-containing protein [Candidatus Hydrogenedentes bacterium]|nr:DUF4962 domain-containing protein [Candidatus Hydrogenedentota bacterium]
MSFLALVLSSYTCAASPLFLDERAAGLGDWGYRPADGSTAVLNPPSFTWRPTKGASTYWLQIARDEFFRNVVYSNNEIRWSAHCPPEPLPAGTYYWCYAARAKTGRWTHWSAVRSVTIPEAAVHFPQPTSAQLTSRLSKEHPRLFFQSEDVPRLQELARGRLADRWQQLKTEADRALAQPPDTSEPPKYPPNIDHKGEEWRNIWWGNRARMVAVGEAAATLAFAYRITGEDKYAHGARDLLLALTKWDPDRATSYVYNDEAAMPALYLVARAYTWAFPGFTSQDRAAINDMMRVRGRQAFDHLQRGPHLWRPYDSHHNRAWHFLGELAIAFYGEFTEAKRWLDYAMTIQFTAYPAWGDADGGWHEGSAYWLSYLDRFTWWAEVLRSSFDIDVYRHPFFQRAGYFGMYLLPPGTGCGGFGDQAADMTSKRIANFMAVLAAGAGNGHWKWYGDAAGGDVGEGYLGFLRAAHSLDLSAQAPTDLPPSLCFRGVGLAVMNTDLMDGTKNIQVQFKSDPTGKQSHGYNANNAFLLNLRGKRALYLTGRRDIHGSEHHRNWMWDTKSDNAILVNYLGQKKHSFSATGRITAFDTTPRIDVVEGEAAGSYEGRLKRCTRRIIFLKPHALVIHDILEAHEPASFQWLLHAPGKFDIHAENTVSWKGDAGQVSIQFLEPSGLRIGQTDQFDPPPAAWTGWKLGEWHLMADAQDKVSHREFVVVIGIDNANVRAMLDSSNPDSKKLHLVLPHGAADITLTDQSFHVQGLGLDRQWGS